MSTVDGVPEHEISNPVEECKKVSLQFADSTTAHLYLVSVAQRACARVVVIQSSDFLL